MSFDNRIFNVNGETYEQLEAALQLAFSLADYNTTAKCWSQTVKHGLVLKWAKEKDTDNLLIGSHDAKTIAPLVWQWLESSEAEAVRTYSEKFAGEDQDDIALTTLDNEIDLDGSLQKGWRVFVETWGHVNGSCYAICAIKPVYLWLGK